MIFMTVRALCVSVSNHTLTIETGRYHQQWLPKESRICPYCTHGEERERDRERERQRDRETERERESQPGQNQSHGVPEEGQVSGKQIPVQLRRRSPGAQHQLLLPGIQISASGGLQSGCEGFG